MANRRAVDLVVGNGKARMVVVVDLPIIPRIARNGRRVE